MGVEDIRTLFWSSSQPDALAKLRARSAPPTAHDHTPVSVEGHQHAGHGPTPSAAALSQPLRDPGGRREMPELALRLSRGTQTQRASATVSRPSARTVRLRSKACAVFPASRKSSGLYTEFCLVGFHPFFPLA
jgi:hypothetical protein